MAFIDGTVVNVALPSLQSSLNATAVGLQWVIEAYSLLLSAFLLVGGSLGDHYGRRRIFLIGVSLFAIASVACGFAADIRQLILSRAVQGLGAALLIPGSLSIISTSFSENERGRAIGTWSGASAITAGIGPVIGGWLIEHVSWRAVFFINVPMALLVVLLSLKHVPESSDNEKVRVDWLGAMLAALSLGGLVYGLIESSRLGFANPMLIVVLATGAILLVVFVLLEARIPHPMLPLTLFRLQTFTGTNLVTLLLYAALGGTLFFLPLNLIQVQHYSATAAGAALLPFILIMSALSRWSGGLVIAHGAKIPLIIGPLVAAVGFAGFCLPNLGGSYWTTFFPPTIFLGLGMAMTVAPLTTTVMNSVSQNHAGLASGVNNAIARTAGLLAIAIFGIVMLQLFSQQLDRNLKQSGTPPQWIQSVESQRTKLAGIVVPETVNGTSREVIRRAIDQAFISGFRTVMTIGAGLAVAAAVTALTLIEARPRRG